MLHYLRKKIAAAIANWASTTRLVASDGVANDRFGISISLNSYGSLLAVGAPYSDPKGLSSGSVYVFSKTGDTWAPTKLVPSDGAAYASFGYCVALSPAGNILVVGSNGVSSNRGTAYVYTRSGNTWTQQMRLNASDGASYDQFGITCAINAEENTIAVGAGGDDTGRGAVYVYTGSGGYWTQQAKIVLPNRYAYDNFGQSVSLSANGNKLLIGASGASGARGQAWVYTRIGTTWSDPKLLTAPDSTADARFGHCCALSADGLTAVCCAPWADPGGVLNAGSAYVLTWTGSAWQHQATLVSPNGSPEAQFGKSVSLSADGNLVLIGASDEDLLDTNTGSAYVFTRTGAEWSRISTIQATIPGMGGGFGYTTAMSSNGSTLAISSIEGNSYKGYVEVLV